MKSFVPRFSAARLLSLTLIFLTQSTAQPLAKGPKSGSIPHGVTVSVVPYAAAQEASHDSSNPARNTVYGEGSFIVYAGAVSANYERLLLPWLSVRAGVGAGYYFVRFDADAGAGVLGMLLYHTSASDHKFEAGSGICWMSRSRPGLLRLLPAITLGYRYQPAAGGLFFRVGVNWSYLYGLPFQVSFGQSF